MIEEHRPHAALFTTYTLSLSFFESVFTPSLRRLGCHEVAILVDAVEASASLDEAQARYAGRRYWVAPVVAPGGGIFHPKIAYLASDNADLLIVGSGNMTLPGQSSQLECLDALLSTEHPGVFQQVAEFMRNLAKRIRPASPRASELLLGCAARADASAGKSGAQVDSQAPSRCALIHTLEQSASSSIEAFWRSGNQTANALTVLSPFHSPSGAPVVRLASALGAGQLEIGLEPRSLVAPFDEKLLPIGSINRYVTPVVASAMRGLHAKVFQIRGSEQTLVVTGSINATKQSLETTKNVEVSLARWCDEPPFAWEVTDPLRFEPNLFDPGQRGAASQGLDAILRNGTVQGCVWSSSTLPEHVRASLLLQGEAIHLHPELVLMGEDGSFSFGPVPDLDTNGAIQLRLVANSWTLEGWLNVEDDLIASDEERRNRAAVKSLLSGNFNEEDVAQLLQLFAQAVSEASVPTVQATSGRRNDGSPADESPVPEFTFQQWSSSGSAFRRTAEQWTRDSRSLQGFIRWLNADLEARTSIVPERSEGAAAASGFASLDAKEKESERNEPLDLSSMLNRLVQSIPDLLRRRPEAACGPTLATVAAAFAIKMSLTSHLEPAAAASPLLKWLSEFSEFAFPASGRSDIARTSVGLAVVAGAMHKRAGIEMPTALLKEAVDRFVARAELDSDLVSLAAAALNSDLFARVDNDLKVVAKVVVEQLAQAESLDERLLRLVERTKDPVSASDPSEEALFKGVFDSLKRSRRSKRRGLNHTVLKSEKFLRGCPHSGCGRALPEAVVRELKARHAAVCPNSLCGGAIFFLEDPAVASAVAESLHHA